jgi:hypothetical protein
MRFKLFIFAFLVLIFSSSVYSELSVLLDDNGNFSGIIFSYNDAPENEFWKKFSNSSNRILLNENGDCNLDGEPHFAIDPTAGLPAVVWSKFDGNDYEIAYSYFNGSIWSNYEFLTDNDQNDFDSRLAFNNEGTIKVTWWVDEPVPEIYYKIRKNSEPWSSSVRVSNISENSKYPSLVASADTSYIPYEISHPPNNKYIIIGSGTDAPDPIPSFSLANIGSSDFGQKSEPLPHSENGHLWVDWIYDGGFLCWSEKIGDQWTVQRYEPYSDSEDIPRARLYIKIKVLNGQ